MSIKVNISLTTTLGKVEELESTHGNPVVQRALADAQQLIEDAISGKPTKVLVSREDADLACRDDACCQSPKTVKPLRGSCGMANRA